MVKTKPGKGGRGDKGGNGGIFGGRRAGRIGGRGRGHRGLLLLRMLAGDIDAWFGCKNILANLEGMILYAIVHPLHLPRKTGGELCGKGRAVLKCKNDMLGKC